MTSSPAPVRVVIGEDDVLMREGIARLLAEAGFEVAAHAGDAESFLRKAQDYDAWLTRTRSRLHRMRATP